MTHKGHAAHNEKACDFLLDSGRFNDWVVTTAFYSALHYVCHELFPLEQNGVAYDCFDRYYRALYKSNGSTKTKHAVIISLLKLYLYPAITFYRPLFDECMKARYLNYRVSNTIATKARNDLERLKRQLSK
jgi:hypothetical protein